MRMHKWYLRIVWEKIDGHYLEEHMCCQWVLLKIAKSKQICSRWYRISAKDAECCFSLKIITCYSLQDSTKRLKHKFKIKRIQSMLRKNFYAYCLNTTIGEHFSNRGKFRHLALCAAILYKLRGKCLWCCWIGSTSTLVCLIKALLHNSIKVSNCIVVLPNIRWRYDFVLHQYMPRIDSPEELRNFKPTVQVCVLWRQACKYFIV